MPSKLQQALLSRSQPPSPPTLISVVTDNAIRPPIAIAIEAIVPASVVLPTDFDPLFLSMVRLLSANSSHAGHALSTIVRFGWAATEYYSTGPFAKANLEEAARVFYRERGFTVQSIPSGWSWYWMESWWYYGRRYGLETTKRVAEGVLTEEQAEQLMSFLKGNF